MNAFTQKFLLAVLAMLISVSVAFAENYDIREMTPQIQQALQNRQSRFSELQALKAQGVLGENNQGLISVLESVGTAPSIVNAENQDRSLIYEAIVAQNNLGASNLSKVKSVFAEVQREKARSGDIIQQPSGKWVRK